MIHKSYSLTCDIDGETCRSAWVDDGGSMGTRATGFRDLDAMRAYATKAGWRAVASRMDGVVKVRDVCPECAVITVGAV